MSERLLSSGSAAHRKDWISGETVLLKSFWRIPTHGYYFQIFKLPLLGLHWASVPRVLEDGGRPRQRSSACCLSEDGVPLQWHLLTQLWRSVARCCTSRQPMYFTAGHCLLFLMTSALSSLCAGAVLPRGAEPLKNLALSKTTVFLLVVLFSSVDPGSLQSYFKEAKHARCNWAGKYTRYLFSEPHVLGSKNLFRIPCVSPATRPWHAHCNLSVLQSLWVIARGPSWVMLSRKEKQDPGW